MNNLISYNKSENADENSYLYFQLGENKYAIKVQQIVEIMKLPMLDYPQKLSNNAVGLLKYDNFIINVLDLRFYLDIKVTPYSTSSQLLIVKTDESIFGLVVDKAENIFILEPSNIEPFLAQGKNKIIDFIYKEGNDNISVIDLCLLENVLKQDIELSDIDIASLFPKDDDSKYELTQRNLRLQSKNYGNISTDVAYQDKFVTFSLNENKYCINFEYVTEFLKNLPITKIPCSRDYIEGVITLKGDFIVIINLKKFLGELIQDSESISVENNNNNIIILECPDYKIGIIVDYIFGINNISEDLLTKKTNDYNKNKYVLKEIIMNDEFYTILNMDAIFSDEKMFIEDN